MKPLGSSEDGRPIGTDGLILSIDIGTTSTKCNAFDLRGNSIADTTVSHPTQYPQEGWVEQQGDDWIDSVSAAVRSIVHTLGPKAQSLTAIGLTGQGGSLIFCDEDGRPLTPCLTWLDHRSQGLGEVLLSELGPENLGGALATTGYAAKLSWALKYWPGEVARARWGLGAKEFIGKWLTGEACTDPKAHEWGIPVLEAVGFPRAKLPDEYPSTHVVGEIKAEVAEAIGVPRGLPVVNGLYDGACAAVGAGAIQDGNGCLTVGSNALARLVAAKPMNPQVGHAIGAFWYPFVDDLWLLGGGTNAGGLCLDWLAGVAAPSRRSAHAMLLREAAGVPAGSEGLVFLPHLLGRGCPSWSPNARGAFVGLSMRHSRGHLVRAVLEGVAYAVKGIYDALTAEGLPLNSVALTGRGGQNPLWRQVLSSVLQRDLAVIDGGSARGAAILAAVGTGAYADVRSAVSAMVTPVALVQPEYALAPLYLEAYLEYARTDQRVTA